jgi:hypothetical protein
MPPPIPVAVSQADGRCLAFPPQSLGHHLYADPSGRPAIKGFLKCLAAIAHAARRNL